MAGIAGGVASNRDDDRGHRGKSIDYLPYLAANKAVVHAEATLLNRDRDGFDTVTFDQGVLISAGEGQLTVKQQVRDVEGKTVTVEVPDSAKVRRNNRKTSLSSLVAGDRVTITQTADRTVVEARGVRPKREGDDDEQTSTVTTPTTTTTPVTTTPTTTTTTPERRRGDNTQD
jgi:hypothetical protein